MDIQKLFNAKIQEVKASFYQFIDGDNEIRRSQLVTVAGFTSPGDSSDGSISQSLTARQYSTLEDAVFVVSTAGAYAAGNVLSDVLEIEDFFPEVGATMWLDSFTLLDKADQTAFDFRVWVMGGDYSLGTLRDAASISDADAANIQNNFDVFAGDSIDIGGAKFYKARFDRFIIKAEPDSRSLWLQLQIGTAGGPPTFADAGDLIGKVGGFA